MINLSIQIKLIIFSFIFGFLFSLVLDFFYKLIKNINKVFSILMSFFLILFMTIIYFIGISKIGYIIFHIYSVLIIVIGFFTYDIIIRIIANKDKK